MPDGAALDGQEREHDQRSHRRWRLLDTVVGDWQKARVLCYGLLLLVLSIGIVAAYYLNHPTPETNPDTATYLRVAQRILRSGDPIDPVRTPGYPFFIALLWLVRGSGHLEVISLAQGGLFILATLEIYVLAWLMWNRAWIGLLVGLLVVSNTYLLSYVKPIIVEGLSLWLTVSLALAVVWYLRRVSARRLWLVTALVLATFMTRPEWVLLPLVLSGFLLFIAARQGQLRRLLPHMLAAGLVLYSLLGLLVYENTVQYGYTGITELQGGNLLGKVLQYHMQNEAPPQYTHVMQEIDAFLAQPLPHGRDPNILAAAYPDIGRDYWAVGGGYAFAVIQAHPVEFVLKSLPFVFIPPLDYHAYSRIDLRGPFGWELTQLQRSSRWLYLADWSFFFWACVWVALLCWRRTRRLPAVEAMSAVLLIVLYQLVLDSLGVYVDFRRFRAPIEPLLVLIVWGSLLWVLSLGWQRYSAQKNTASAPLEQAARTEREAGG